MTISAQRTRSLLRTHDFLLKLLDPKATPHTPKYVRDEASRLAKHFPGAADLQRICRGEPQELDAATLETHLAKRTSH